MRLNRHFYLQLKNFLKSINKLCLIVYQMYWWNARKQSIFHIFASDLLSRQACQNAVNHVFEKQIYIFLRITQVLRFCTKNNGIIRNDIEENVLFYRVVGPQESWIEASLSLCIQIVLNNLSTCSHLKRHKNCNKHFFKKFVAVLEIKWWIVFHVNCLPADGSYISQWNSRKISENRRL